jgi:type 1 fimbria pilin
MIEVKVTGTTTRTPAMLNGAATVGIKIDDAGELIACVYGKDRRSINSLMALATGDQVVIEGELRPQNRCDIDPGSGPRLDVTATEVTLKKRASGRIF